MKKKIFIFVLSALYTLVHTTIQSMGLMITYKQYQKKLQKRINQNLSGDELNKPYNLLQHPLHIQLIHRGYTDLINLLFERLHTDNMQYIYNSGLIASAYNANFELIKLFVQRGADVNTYEAPECYQTPLIKLCAPNSYPVKILQPLNFLLIHNANPNLPSRWTHSPNKTVLMALSALKTTSKIQEAARCKAVQHVTISGANIIPEIPEESHEVKTAATIARERNNHNLATLIETTANNRDELFEEVKSGKNVNFIDTKQIPPRYVRDIKGNNLLWYALTSNNKPVAQKLLYLWPELLTQPNFESDSILNNAKTRQSLALMFAQSMGTA